MSSHLKVLFGVLCFFIFLALGTGQSPSKPTLIRVKRSHAGGHHGYGHPGHHGGNHGHGYGRHGHRHGHGYGHQNSYYDYSKGKCGYHEDYNGFCHDKYAGHYGHPKAECYIQCDEWGNTFVRPCAWGTKWKGGHGPTHYNACVGYHSYNKYPHHHGHGHGHHGYGHGHGHHGYGHHGHGHHHHGR